MSMYPSGGMNGHDVKVWKRYCLNMDQRRPLRAKNLLGNFPFDVWGTFGGRSTRRFWQQNIRFATARGRRINLSKFTNKISLKIVEDRGLIEMERSCP